MTDQTTFCLCVLGQGAPPIHPRTKERITSAARPRHGGVVPAAGRRHQTRLDAILRRYDERCAPFYLRGQPEKLALTTAIRKLIVTLIALLREGTPWRAPQSARLPKTVADTTS